ELGDAVGLEPGGHAVVLLDHVLHVPLHADVVLDGQWPVDLVPVPREVRTGEAGRAPDAPDEGDARAGVLTLAARPAELLGDGVDLDGAGVDAEVAGQRGGVDRV